MKKHTKVYLNHFGYKSLYFDDLYIPCEWCDGLKGKAVDVNHIEARGMGGGKTKDYIENLVGMCRACHIDFEAKRISKEELREKHLKNC